MNDNRVKLYYEVACEYLSLPSGIRYNIATRLGFTNFGILAYPSSDKMDRDVFVGVAKKQNLQEFKQLIREYNEYDI